MTKYSAEFIYYTEIIEWDKKILQYIYTETREKSEERNYKIWILYGLR